MKKAMLISLGGTPAPLIFSLNHNKPEYICFFVSRESVSSISEDVLPGLDFAYEHYDWIVTPSAEDLTECYKAIYQNLPRILKKWGIAPKDLVVDYTGGTKTMSAALVLATIEESSSYTYIGGVERTKEGLGVVIEGRERMLYRTNPWDELAVSQKKAAALLFNRAGYAAAATIFARIPEKVRPRNKVFFEGMHDLSVGYDLWDKFKHKEAKAKLYRSRKVIDAFASGSEKPEMVALSTTMEKNLAFLEKLTTDHTRKGLFLCYDLLSNAKRRAELESKYDDAVARLYRTIEALAQFRLNSEYGIHTAKADINKIPVPLRGAFQKKYTDEKTNTLKIPLYASFLVLKELGDKLGLAFFDNYEKRLRSILGLRNQSVLAHGFVSVSEETYKNMYSAVLDFAEITEDELPEFPHLMP